MGDGTILDPVFLISNYQEGFDEILLAYELEKFYGLASIRAIHKSAGGSKEGKPYWGYKLLRKDGKAVMEIRPKVELFHGRVVSELGNQFGVHICTTPQRKLIIDWIDQLNKSRSLIYGQAIS